MIQTNRRDVLRGAIALGLHSVISSNSLALGISSTVAPRERLLLDFDWKFQFGHASDPLRDLGFGADQDDFSKTGAFEFATEKFDASNWRSLNLPHDWAVELPFVRDEALQSHGYKPLGRKYPETSVGWYRRGFDIPASDLGKRIVL